MKKILYLLLFIPFLSFGQGRVIPIDYSVDYRKNLQVRDTLKLDKVLFEDGTIQNTAYNVDSVAAQIGDSLLNRPVGVDSSKMKSNYQAHLDSTKLHNQITTKQATLISGTNIKTINSTSLLGSGNVVISGVDSTLMKSNYQARLDTIKLSNQIAAIRNDTVQLFDLVYPKDSLYTKYQIDTMAVDLPENTNYTNYQKQYLHIDLTTTGNHKLIDSTANKGIVINSAKIIVDRSFQKLTGTKTAVVSLISLPTETMVIGQKKLTGAVADTIFILNNPSKLQTISGKNIYLKVDTASDYDVFEASLLLDYDKVTLRSFPSQYLAESDTLFNHMTGLNDAWKVAIDSCIRLLKDSAIWQSADVLAFINLNNSANSLLNWIDYTQSFTNNTATFVAKTGFTGGSNRYINTNYNPTTDAINYSVNNACIAVGVVTASAGPYFAAEDNSYFHQYAGGIYKYINNKGFNTNTFSNPSGIVSISRSGNADSVYYAGTMYDHAESHTGASIPNLNFHVFHSYSANYSACTVDFIYIGAHLESYKQRRLKNIRAWFNNKKSSI